MKVAEKIILFLQCFFFAASFFGIMLKALHTTNISTNFNLVSDTHFLKKIYFMSFTDCNETIIKISISYTITLTQFACGVGLRGI